MANKTTPGLLIVTIELFTFKNPGYMVGLLLKTRMHSSGMHTIRSSSHLSGGSASVHAGIPDPPGPGTPPGADTPLDQAPPGSRHPQTRHSPRSRPPQRPVARHAGIPPAIHTGIAHPPETCCKACWDTTHPPPPPWTDTHL